MRIRWRGFELPSQISCDRKSLTSTYGKFVAEPFERGFGDTIGNSLRRILISSLEGSAITQVKFHGVQHEFSTLPGVAEDITEIVLNVKSLIVKNHGDGAKVVRVEKTAAGTVTGRDVLTDHTVEVINKDHILATLTANVGFSMEMVVENGRRYVPATERQGVAQEIGTIPVDAVFSPVVRVKYSVEETRVGQKTNYDRLTIEIWTNGSIHPEMALVEAAKILRKHLNPFVQLSELGLSIPTDGRPPLGGSDSALESKLSMSLSGLGLSNRALNSLESGKILTVRDLVSKTEDQLLELKNFGETSLSEVRARLAEAGLRLGMRVVAHA
jgi:DNA-directed RNA polymerase subunit alpha